MCHSPFLISVNTFPGFNKLRPSLINKFITNRHKFEKYLNICIYVCKCTCKTAHATKGAHLV